MRTCKHCRINNQVLPCDLQIVPKCSKNDYRMAVTSEDCFLRMHNEITMCLSSPIKYCPKELYTDMPVMWLIPTANRNHAKTGMCVKCTGVRTAIINTSSTCKIGEQVIPGKCIMFPVYGLTDKLTGEQVKKIKKLISFLAVVQQNLSLKGAINWKLLGSAQNIFSQQSLC